jgi:hypothetical protein
MSGACQKHQSQRGRVEGSSSLLSSEMVLVSGIPAPCGREVPTVDRKDGRAPGTRPNVCLRQFPTYELDRSKVDENYLRWFFRHPDVWEQARLMSTGSAALSKLTPNPPKFLDLTIPLPPTIEEQRQIAMRIEAVADDGVAAKMLIASRQGRPRL